MVLEPVCANKVRNGPPSADQHLLAQNLSSKRIAPSDNMRPKSDDAKWHHRWLKCSLVHAVTLMMHIEYIWFLQFQIKIFVDILE